jgi:hypothetical protein
MSVEFTITDRLDEQQRRQWIDFWLASTHAHPRQHPGAADVQRALGREVVYVIGTEHRRIVCAGAFAIHRSAPPLRSPLEAVCLRGPVFDDPEIGRQCLEVVLGYGRECGIGRIRVAPYWLYPEAQSVEQLLVGLGFAPCNRQRDPCQHTGHVNLARDEHDLYSSLSKGFRKQVRAARQKQVRVEVVVDRRQATDFYELYHAMQSSRGLAILDVAEFEALFERVFVPREFGVALHALRDDELLGGLYLMRSRAIVFPAQYALSNQDHRGQLPASISIGPMLWWEAMRWGQRSGCAILDLEGYRPPNQRGAPRPGMYAFKQRMRPEHVTITSQHSRPCHTLHDAALRGLNACHRLAGRTRRLYASLRAA